MYPITFLEKGEIYEIILKTTEKASHEIQYPFRNNKNKFNTKK